MKIYVGNKPKPSVRDGKWVVTVNRTFVWSGRTGWCRLAKLGKWDSAKQYARPGGNAVFYSTCDDAKELIVRYGIFGKHDVESPFVALTEGKERRFFRQLPTTELWRPNRIMEPALVENGVLVWDVVWVVARGPTFYATHNHPMPAVPIGQAHCYTLEQLFEKAFLFSSKAEAEKNASGILCDEVLEVSKHGQLARLSQTVPDYP